MAGLLKIRKEDLVELRTNQDDEFADPRKVMRIIEARVIERMPIQGRRFDRVAFHIDFIASIGSDRTETKVLEERCQMTLASGICVQEDRATVMAGRVLKGRA